MIATYGQLPPRVTPIEHTTWERHQDSEANEGCKNEDKLLPNLQKMGRGASPTLDDSSGGSIHPVDDLLFLCRDDLGDEDKEDFPPASTSTLPFAVGISAHICQWLLPTTKVHTWYQAQNGYRETGDAEEGEEDEDKDGGYWDNIYDEYHSSCYSFMSKHFSIPSKALGISKASSKACANAPPIASSIFSSNLD
ncbi:hypothetical protein BDN67DRAFT_985489 [Paxillus ammoniavirescens]|nr:hypothetical protein BDN67DRAFT_985489 [Paxillus ammoniavirescens]